MENQGKSMENQGTIFFLSNGLSAVSAVLLKYKTSIIYKEVDF
jgi:hypothetical protein